MTKLSFYTHLGKAVREARERRSLSQEALGRLLGATKSTVCRIETGAMMYPVHEYPRLARALRIRTDQLFPQGFFGGKR